MKPRAARWIAWSLVGIYILLGVVGLVLQTIAGKPYVEEIGVSGLAVVLTTMGVWPVVGALIVSRHPSHPIGWLMCVGLLAAAVDMFSAGYLAYSDLVFDGTLPGVIITQVWLRNGAFLAFIIVSTFFFLLFPSGQFPSPGWKKVAWLTLGALLVYLPLKVLEPGPVDPIFLPHISNPLAVSPISWRVFNPFLWMASAVLWLCLGAAFLSLILRYRRSPSLKRQQIKWLLVPAGLFALIQPFMFLLTTVESDLLMAVGILVDLPTSAGIAIAAAFAIFKYRLYDIDIIIRRTLLYSVLTISLGLVYFIVVTGLQNLFTALSGQSSTFAVVISTLLIAALFNPLRHRLQVFIDKRFYRQNYDTQQALVEFATAAQHETDIAQLSDLLLATVQETLQPEHTSLWMRPINEAAPHGNAFIGTESR